MSAQDNEILSYLINIKNSNKGKIDKKIMRKSNSTNIFFEEEHEEVIVNSFPLRSSGGDKL